MLLQVRVKGHAAAGSERTAGSVRAAHGQLDAREFIRAAHRALDDQRSGGMELRGGEHSRGEGDYRLARLARGDGRGHRPAPVRRSVALAVSAAALAWP